MLLCTKGGFVCAKAAASGAHQMSHGAMNMMAAIKSIISSGAVGGLAVFSVGANAGEPYTTLRALPLRAVSFDLGSKHAISYFLVNDGNRDSPSG
jgi:hypothetical protein